MKYMVVFPDGDLLQSEDGQTEFSERAARYYKERLAEYVDLEILPVFDGSKKVCGAVVWPYTENNVCIDELGHRDRMHTDPKGRHFDHTKYIKERKD